jgi:hypothetical protein
MQNADVQVPMPTIAHAAGAQEILAKLQQAYTNLTSLNMTGTSVGIMDISAVTADDLNPNQSDDDRNATLKAAKIVRSVTNVTEVSIKLARPDLYQIEGVSKMAVGQIAGVNFTIAVWTAGGTNFVLLGKNFTTVEDRRDWRRPSRSFSLARRTLGREPKTGGRRKMNHWTDKIVTR